MITQILNGVIWYSYKGDEIAWNGYRYISLLCEGEFDTLNDLDLFWEDYAKAAYTRQEVTITRDMAMDAGDLSLEGQTCQW
jgi:hypothetical protein